MLFDFALASGMATFAIHIRRGFHGFALDAAIPTGGCFAGTGRVRALLIL
jgi:hypothetical protein